jgi:ubiquitin C-terminal hydrolase
MYSCEKCQSRQKCIKSLSVYRCPDILVIHIKRFQYNSVVREKLFTDVQFPLTGLNMQPYFSDDKLVNLADRVSDSLNGASAVNISTLDRTTTKSDAIYDLIGVVHHSGGINGGHYVAHVSSRPINTNEVPPVDRVDASFSRSNTVASPAPTTSDPGIDAVGSANSGWTCFNDAHVSPISSNHISGPSAYVLFYQLKK